MSKQLKLIKQIEVYKFILYVYDESWEDENGNLMTGDRPEREYYYILGDKNPNILGSLLLMNFYSWQRKEYNQTIPQKDLSFEYEKVDANQIISIETISNNMKYLLS